MVFRDTWQIFPTGVTTVTGSGDDRNLTRKMKDTLKLPLLDPQWIVVGSSNGVTAGLDGVDRWATDADLLGSTGTWIVLENARTGTQMCWVNTGNQHPFYLNMWVSPSGSFTGGTKFPGGRPTAPDQVSGRLSTAWARYTALPEQFNITAWHAAGGSTVVAAYNSTRIGGILFLPVMVDGPATWLHPEVWSWDPFAGLNPSASLTFASVWAPGLLTGMSNTAGGQAFLGLGVEAYGGGGGNFITDQINEIANAWPVARASIWASHGYGGEGGVWWVGDLPDIGVVKTHPTIPIMDTLLGGDMVALNGWALPWDGSTPSITAP